MISARQVPFFSDAIRMREIESASNGAEFFKLQGRKLADIPEPFRLYRLDDGRFVVQLSGRRRYFIFHP